MLSTMTSARRRLVLITFAAAALALVVVMWLAFRGDDTKVATPDTQVSTQTTIPSTSTSAATDGSAPYDPINPPFQRALQTSGTFTCATPGQWQPYLDRPLVISVGEPPGGSVCAQDVIDLPFGYCSQKPCAQIPPDWDIRLQPGVPPDALFLLVAPVDASNARLYCFRKLVADPVKQGRIGTTIEVACPAGTPGNSPHNSVDIPFVPPPASVDLATIAPNVSNGLPNG